MKTKEVKRKEALIRQRVYLVNVAIRDWCRVTECDPETRKLANERLIASAYSARCDRNGNYLDSRYYQSKNLWNRPAICYTDNLHNALNCEVLSLEEMKQITGGASGRTLYEVAYGI